MTTRTYRSKPARISIRLRRKSRITIAAMAISNGLSFSEQVMALVRQELGA